MKVLRADLLSRIGTIHTHYETERLLVNREKFGESVAPAEAAPPDQAAPAEKKPRKKSAK